MSSISAINSVTKKFSIPFEIENLIYDFLTLEDYDKARAKFNKCFLNRISLNYPSLTLFNGVLGDIINIKEQFIGKLPIMRYIYRKSDKYLNKETKFYDLYDYDDITACGMDFYTVEGGYVPAPNLIEYYDEDDEYSSIKPVEGYDNIEILAETYRVFRCKYTEYSGNATHLLFKYDGVVYKRKILDRF